MMKKFLIFCLFILFAVFIACDNKETSENENVEIFEIIPGGCAPDAKKTFSDFENDTVYYSIESGKLDVFVGFNATCCGDYRTNSEIEDNTFILKITTKTAGMCDCICFYTYDFIFTVPTISMNYEVFIDDKPFWSGTIDVNIN